VTNFDLQPTAATRNGLVGDPGFEPQHPIGVVFGRRRTELVFVAIVAAATLLQALMNPLAAVWSGQPVEWSLPVPFAATVALVVIGCCVQAVALLVTGRRPALAVVATLGVYLLLVVTLSVPQWLTGMQLVVATALFMLGSVRAARTALGWCAVGLASFVAVLFAWSLAIGTEVGLAAAFVLAQGVSFLAVTAGATALGLWWGEQYRRTARERQQVESATREYETRVARERELERERIAQELHDVAAQHLSGLIALTDGALAIASTQPEAALRLVEEVRAEGLFAAASLYGALEDLSAVGGEQRGATRDLRRVDELIDFWRQRGASVGLQVVGGLDDVPAVVSTTGFRCVQEALTNAAKHAPGARVRVEINAAADHLHVAVENDPPADSAAPAGVGLGWGLSGLRKRVNLLDGTLVTAATDDGGFRVQMRVPTRDFGPSLSGAHR
jgi:signal transduction histidine kinase